MKKFLVAIHGLKTSDLGVSSQIPRGAPRSGAHRSRPEAATEASPAELARSRSMLVLHNSGGMPRGQPPSLTCHMHMHIYTYACLGASHRRSPECGACGVHAVHAHVHVHRRRPKIAHQSHAICVCMHAHTHAHAYHIAHQLCSLQCPHQVGFPCERLKPVVIWGGQCSQES